MSLRLVNGSDVVRPPGSLPIRVGTMADLPQAFGRLARLVAIADPLGPRTVGQLAAEHARTLLILADVLGRRDTVRGTTGGPMTTPPHLPRTAGDLTQVRTAADATAWLSRRATEYLAEAEDEPSPDRARGLRLARSTLEAIAVVSREWRDGVTAADGLMRLARCYPEEEIADLPPEARYYQLACGHVADALGQVAAQLTHATAPERARRVSVGASQRPVSRGRGL